MQRSSRPRRARELICLAALPFFLLSSSAFAIEGSFLGVALAESIPEAIQTHLEIDGGAMVSQIVPDSPAARAGLQRHDIIVAVGDHAIASSADLTAQIATRKPGDRIQLSVRRGAKSLELEVTLGAREDAPASAPVETRKPGFLGVSYDAPSADLSGHLGLEPGHGVLVRSVLDGSGAKSADIREFDVLLGVNGERLSCEAPRVPQPLSWQWSVPPTPPTGSPHSPPADHDEDALQDGHHGLWWEGAGPARPRSNLPELIGKLHSGDVVSLELVRNGERLTREVTLGERPDEPELGHAELPEGADRLFWFGDPRKSARGSVVIIGPDGERRIELPRLRIEGEIDLDELLAPLRKQGLGAPELRQIEEAFRKLRFDRTAPRLDPHAPGEVHRSTRRSSQIQIDDGTYRLKIEENDGARRVWVEKGDETICEELPWDQIGTLPEDVRSRLEKIEFGTDGPATGATPGAGVDSKKRTPRLRAGDRGRSIKL